MEAGGGKPEARRATFSGFMRSRYGILYVLALIVSTAALVLLLLSDFVKKSTKVVAYISLVGCATYAHHNLILFFIALFTYQHSLKRVQEEIRNGMRYQAFLYANQFANEQITLLGTCLLTAVVRLQHRFDLFIILFFFCLAALSFILASLLRGKGRFMGYCLMSASTYGTLSVAVSYFKTHPVKCVVFIFCSSCLLLGKFFFSLWSEEPAPEQASTLNSPDV